MSEQEITNTIPAGQEATPVANAAPEGSQVTPEKTPENNEPLYAINYRGQEEKLPLAKIINYAQQGRDYSEKMGKFNTEVETRANELAQAALDKFYQEQEAAKVPGETPAEGAGGTPEALDEFTLLKQEVEQIKQKEQQIEHEKKVNNYLNELNNNLAKATEKYPFADQMNVLAILRSDPNADVMKLAELSHNKEKERRDKFEAEFLEKAKERSKKGAENAGGVVTGIPQKEIVLGQNTQEAAAAYMSRFKS